MGNLFLTQILEEITISYNSNNQQSKKLHQYVELIRGILQENGAILESKSIQFRKLENDLENGTVFLQGSYAYGTAIKHESYDVDADIGFLAEEELDVNARQRIFELINNRLGTKYKVLLKKPCITIDFLDKYKIDITIYSVDRTNKVFFHNNINGTEEKTVADPKGLVSFLKNYISKSNYRDVLRLTKHFIKTVTQSLRISNDNKIPSISLCLFAQQNNYSLTNVQTEADLYSNLLRFIKDFKFYVIKNGKNGPECSDYYVTNTFYKVINVSDLIKVLEFCEAALTEFNYSLLINKSVLESLDNKNKLDKTPSFTGTFGNGKV